MKKKMLLFVFLLFICFAFNGNIEAKTCKYTNVSGRLSLTYKIDDENDIDGDAIVHGYMDAQQEYVENEAENIENWDSRDDGSSQSGQEYYKATGKCPEVAIIVDHANMANMFGDKFYVYVVGEKNLADQSIFIKVGRERQGYQILSLIDQKLVDKKYTINFKNTMDAAEGSMKSISATYGKPAYIPESGYKLYGWQVLGFKVFNNGKWLCKSGYKKDCEADDDSYYIVSPKSTQNLKFDSKKPVIDLYTVWETNANIDSQTINQYFTGDTAKGYCEGNGFVWNKTNGGYCNTDKLQYVTCGDSYDIPREAPNLISYFVNILKIATPIILIVVSMIKLLKALMAPNEDEIKKAQNSLIKKIIASVMVFFVISIVQFIIMKVADSTETKSISNCMSCFLNNDCAKTTYYKTNIGGIYYCTEVLETGLTSLKSCNEFYKEETKDFVN